MVFDPKAYLASKQESNGFDPRAYLSSKGVSPQPSMLDKIAEADTKYVLNPISKVAGFLGKYGTAVGQEGSPQSLLTSAPGVADYIASRFGQKVAEDLSTKNPVTGANPTNPYVAAGVGTLISMSPSIALSAANPLPDNPSITPASEAAVPVAEKAIGFPKRMRGNPFIRGRNAEAARVALEENVIPWTGSRTKMMQNAVDLQTKAAKEMNDVFSQAKQWVESGGNVPPMAEKGLSIPGKENLPSTSIGGAETIQPQVFEETAKVVDPKELIKSVQKYKPNKPAQGFYADDYKVYNKVLQTIKAHGSEPLTLSEANALKTRIQSEINYKVPGQILQKKMARAITDAVDTSLENVANQIGQPELKSKFMSAKRKYGAAVRMQDGINDLISKKGNKFFDLASLGAGGLEFAISHNPIKAAATALAAKGVTYAGPSATAKLINQVGTAGATGPSFINPLLAAKSLNKKAKK